MTRRILKQPIRVFLIVDTDNERSRISTALQSANFNVTEYQTAREFLIDKRNYDSGVVLAEFRLQGISGVKLVEKLEVEVASFPVILIVGNKDVPKVVKSGADIIVKPADDFDVVDAVNRSLVPEVFSIRDLERGFKMISDREGQVLKFILDGHSCREIGNELGLSTKTIEAHRSGLMNRIRAKDVGELIRKWNAWQALQ